MFDHQGGRRIQFFNLREIGRVVEHAIADKRFVYLDGGMFGRHRNVFGVTADNPRPEYAKALFDILGVVIKLAWAGDNIDRVKVHRKSRTVDGFNQARIDFWAIGQEIRLGFDD